MLLWSSVYSTLSETSFLPCPELIIFLISDFSLPKFLPAVSLNLKAFEWFPCPCFPASFISFSFENILLVKGRYFVLGSFPLASCAYLPAHPSLWCLTSIEEMTVPSLVWERTGFLYLTFLPKGTGLMLLCCLPLTEPSLPPLFASVGLFQSNCLLQSNLTQGICIFKKT